MRCARDLPGAPGAAAGQTGRREVQARGCAEGMRRKNTLLHGMSRFLWGCDCCALKSGVRGGGTGVPSAAAGDGSTSEAVDGGVPQTGAAGAPQPRHMTPCACHCAACRAAGHGNTCIVLRMGLLRLFHGKTDIVALILRHYHGASAWRTVRFGAAIKCVQYGPAGDVIAAGFADGRIQLICAQTGEKFPCPTAGHRWVNSIAWNKNGTQLASGGNDKTVKIWSVSAAGTLECQSMLQGHTAEVMGVCFSPDGKQLASGSWDGEVVIWNLATGEQLFQQTVDSRVRSIIFAPCGTKLAAACNNYPRHCVKIFCKEGSTGKFGCQSTLRGESQMHCVAFSPDGCLIAAGDGDTKTYDNDRDATGTIRLYHAATGAPFGSLLRGHAACVYSVAWSPDGRLASGSLDKTVRIWNPATGEQLCQLRCDATVYSVAFSPDATIIAAGCYEKVQLLDTVTSSPVRAV